MKKQIALSIEQMQELQSLGLDCSDASMSWTPVFEDGGKYKLSHHLLMYNNIGTPLEVLKEQFPLSCKDVHYAYTLQDILEKLPKEILRIPLDLGRTSYGKWWCGYSNEYLRNNIICVVKDTPLEAAFGCLIECIKLKYIKGEKE